MYDCRILLDDETEAALRSRFPGRRIGDAARQALHEWVAAGGKKGRVVTDRETLDEIIRAAMRDQERRRR